MILLTVAYIVFNAPLVIYTLAAFLQMLTGTTVFDGFLNAFHGHVIEEKGKFHLLNFTFTVSVCLNSTTNAVLFTSRSGAIKSWFNTIIKDKKRKVEVIVLSVSAKWYGSQGSTVTVNDNVVNNTENMFDNPS